MEVTLEKVKEAINALNNISTTKEANLWLINFEKSQAAWEISMQLVDFPPGDSFRFFGAKFLYSKIQRQYVLLEKFQVEKLAEGLVNQIIRFAAEPVLELNTCRYLCLSLADLALQMNQAGVVKQILQWLNPVVGSKPEILLILLTVLPEEVHNQLLDITSDTRESFIKQLTLSAPDVFGFLSHLWTMANLEVKTAILRCACQWIETTDVSSSVIADHQINTFALSGLSTYSIADNVLICTPEKNSLFDQSVDVVLAIIKRFSEIEPHVVDIFLPHIFSLCPVWKKLTGNLTSIDDSLMDEDVNAVLNSICRLFTETAETCISRFSYPDQKLGQEQLLDQLIECTSLAADHNISGMPLNFFYNLSFVMSDSSYNVAQMHQIYSKFYISLFNNAINSLCLNYEMVKGEVPMSSEVIQRRYDWKEAVLTCAYILGGNNCIIYLCEEIEKSIVLQDIAIKNTRLESILYCVYIIIPSLPLDDNIYIPQLINFILNNLSLNPIYRLEITSINLFGMLGKWLEKNNSYLPNVLNKLFPLIYSPDYAKEASLAIMDIFTDCCKLNTLPVIDLMNHYLNILKHPIIPIIRAVEEERRDEDYYSNSRNTPDAVSLKIDLNVLQAVITGSYGMNEQDRTSVFRTVSFAVAAELSASFQREVESLSKVQNSVSYADRMSTIFRCYKLDKPDTSEVFLELFPLLKKIAEKNPNDYSCEKLCRCYKYAIRCCPKSLATSIPIISEHLIEQFQIYPCAAFLYCASISFSSFALLDNRAHVPILYKMLWSLSNIFFEKFPSVEHFHNKPDIVEEYFYLLSKVLQYAPLPFLNFPTEVNMIFEVAMTCLFIEHREIQQGILMFFENLIQIFNFSIQDFDETQRIKSFLSFYSKKIIEKILLFLSYQYNIKVFSINEPHGSVTDVIYLIKKFFKQEFPIWIQESLQILPSHAQIIANRHKFYENLIANQSKHSLAKVIERFERSCSRNNNL